MFGSVLSEIETIRNTTLIHSVRQKVYFGRLMDKGFLRQRATWPPEARISGVNGAGI